MSILRPFRGDRPRVASSAFVAENAALIGRVEVGEEASIWYGAVLRGDILPIRVGARTSIQDQCVLHTTTDWAPTEVGEEVTVGHGAILHGCHIAPRVLVGMGSIVMDGARIDSDVILGAGSLVPPRAEIPSGVLALGRPARVVRALRPEERAQIREAAEEYVRKAAVYRAAG